MVASELNGSVVACNIEIVRKWSIAGREDQGRVDNERGSSGPMGLEVSIHERLSTQCS
jgi:hypothetical protein